MKRLLLLAVAAIVVLGFAAPRPTKASEPDHGTTTPASVAVAVVDGKRMGVINFNALNAPSIPAGGTLFISNEELTALGTENVRVIYKAHPRPALAKQIGGPSNPVEQDKGYALGYEAWWGPWEFLWWLDRDDYEEHAEIGNILGSLRS